MRNHCQCGARCADDCECGPSLDEIAHREEIEAKVEAWYSRQIHRNRVRMGLEEPEDGPVTRRVAALRRGLQRDMVDAGMLAPPMEDEEEQREREATEVALRRRQAERVEAERDEYGGESWG